MSTQIQAAPSMGPHFFNDEAMERMWKFAEKIAPSQFIKPKIRGDVPTVFHQLCIGEELGLLWTHAARGIFLGQNGGVGVDGQTILALLLSHSFKVDFKHQTEPVIGCTCTITRPGEAEGKSWTFTMDDARRIRTEIKDRAKNEWYTLADTFRYLNHPAQMTQWRSLANCARMQAADLMGGIYLPEELEEATGTAGPAPEENGNGNGKPVQSAPPADEFVVGEKPEPPVEVVAETKPPEPETAPVQVETAPPVNGTPKPPVETAKPEPDVKYHLCVVITPAEGGKPELVAVASEVPQLDKEVATLRARAIATEKNLPCVAVKWVDGKPVEEDTIICNPPSASAPRPQNKPEPQPEGAKPADPQAEFNTLIGKVDAVVGGEPKDSHKLIARFFKAYCQTDKTPKDITKTLPALQKLAAVIEARVGDLRAAPEQLGAELGGHAKDPAEREFATLGWPDPVRALARKVMALMGHQPQQFVSWLQAPTFGNADADTDMAITQLEPAAVEILFQIFLLAKGRVFEILDWAIAHKRSITGTLQEVLRASEKPLTEWDAPFAVAIIDALVKIQDDPPDQAAPQQAEDDSDWASGGLPFGG